MMQVLASSLVFGSGGYNLQGWFRLYHPHQIPNVILPRIHIWELGLVLPPFLLPWALAHPLPDQQ